MVPARRQCTRRAGLVMPTMLLMSDPGDLRLTHHLVVPGSSAATSGSEQFASRYPPCAPCGGREAAAAACRHAFVPPFRPSSLYAGARSPMMAPRARTAHGSGPRPVAPQRAPSQVRWGRPFCLHGSSVRVCPAAERAPCGRDWRHGRRAGSRRGARRR